MVRTHRGYSEVSRGALPHPPLVPTVDVMLPYAQQTSDRKEGRADAVMVVVACFNPLSWLTKARQSKKPGVGPVRIVLCAANSPVAIPVGW